MLEKAAKRNEMPRIENLQLPRRRLSWRCISKPPNFNYVHFYISALPSKLRFGKLFPGTIPKLVALV